MALGLARLIRRASAGISAPSAGGNQAREFSIAPLPHRPPPALSGRLAATLALLLLTGCGSPTRPAPPAWDSPETERALGDLLCRIDTDCRWLTFRLYDTDQPLAEVRYRFEIVLSRGMLQRTANEDERAFLLAHELAHVRLDHRPPRNAGERLPQELAADAWAARRLQEAGMNPSAGLALLQRLRDEVGQAEPQPPRGAEALAEYRQRIEAMRRQVNNSASASQPSGMMR